MVHSLFTKINIPFCHFSYSGGSPFSGQFILPGFPGSSAAAAQQQLNLNSLSTSQLPQLSQLSYPPAVLSDRHSPSQQIKKFRPPLKTMSKSQKYIPKPIPQELGNLKTYSKYIISTVHNLLY